MICIIRLGLACGNTLPGPIGGFLPNRESRQGPLEDSCRTASLARASLADKRVM